MATCTNCGYEAEDEFRFCPECGTQWIAPEVSGDPLIGRTLAGKYRVVDTIGSGSMGRVYLAEHVALKKRIALKVLHRDLQVGDEAITRFQREGIAAGQIDHSSVLQIFDFERTDDGLCYLAMEYVDGVNLKQWLQQHAPLEPRPAIRLIRQILSTLVEAHRHGVVHRDLKPENIMVIERGTGGIAIKVLDFGLSKLVDTKVDVSMATIPGRLLGTPLYMAPEQWRGETADHRADLYAATLILYEMLAGKPPFEASDITDAMVNTTQHEPPSIESSHDLPSGLDVIVQKGLAKSRDERFQTASEMVAALDALTEGQAIAQPRRVKARRRAQPVADKRSPKVWVGAAGVAVLAAVGIGWALSGGGASDAAANSLVRSLPTEALSPEQASYLRLLDDARDRLRNGDTRAAMNYVDDAIREACVDAEAYRLRAEIFRAQGDGDTAIAEYRAALKLKGDDAPATAGIGWVRFDRGDLDESQNQFDAALAMDPSCDDALTGRAAVDLARGNAEAACALLDAAPARASDSALVALWRGRANLAANDLPAAREAFVEAKRRNTRLIAAYEGLGDTYRASDDATAAIAQYRAALENDKDAQTVRCKLAEVLLDAELLQDAETALGPALRASTQSPRVQVLAAVIAQEKGDAAQAIHYIEAALQSNRLENRVRALTLLATLRLDAGDAAAAVQACDEAMQAVQARGDDAEPEPALLITQGLAQFQAGAHTLAAEALERAVETDTDNAFVHYTLGVIYMDYLGDDELALEHFEAHVEHGGSNARVTEFIRRLGG